MTTRRETVRAIASIAALPFFNKLGVVDLLEVGRRAHAQAELRRPAVPRALSKAEYDIVTEAAERIIPRTATPGATDARVADFIDVMLADWYDDPERGRFKAGLAELDARARALSGRSFVQTDEKQQIALLETLDQEFQAARQSTASANDHWFATLKHLTVWGYYTSRPGIEQELKRELIPGRYDGAARYNANAGN
jgi:hypothetical protein